MARGPGSASALHRLRRNDSLRLLFVASGLLWALNAIACPVFDLLHECVDGLGALQVSVGLADGTDIQSPAGKFASHSHGAVSHIPCCLHIVGAYVAAVGVPEGQPSIRPAESSVVALASAQFSSHTQTPPTPPPITA